MAEEMDLELDCLFSVLAHSRRRHALACLQEKPGPLPIEELATEIVALEQPSSETVADDAVKQVSITLYHAHLPKLEEADLVRLDKTQKTVAPTDSIESVSSLLPDRCEQ